MIQKNIYLKTHGGSPSSPVKIKFLKFVYEKIMKNKQTVG